MHYIFAHIQDLIAYIVIFTASAVALYRVFRFFRSTKSVCSNCCKDCPYSKK